MSFYRRLVRFLPIEVDVFFCRGLAGCRLLLAVELLLVAFLTVPVRGQTGSGPGDDNVTLNVTSNIEVTNLNAISLGNNATITVNDGVLVQTTTTAKATAGKYGKGDNTIEFNNNSTLTINPGASVIAKGLQTTSEAINPIGAGNTIINFGTVQGNPSSAIFFENIDFATGKPIDPNTSKRNVVDNFGIIEAKPGGSNPGLTGEAIGSFNNVGIDFTNETGAKVIGNLDFQGGNDSVTLLPGSQITGNFDGGGGTNILTLNGNLGTADSLSGTVKNFQTLTKTGLGTWTLTGSIGANGGNIPLTVLVNAGTLVLTGNNSSFNGSIVVNPGSNLATPGSNPLATLQASAQSLPPLITDHGIVLFAQTNDGIYSGLIQGTGVIVKDGNGTLALTGTNTYTGGTFLNQGNLAVAADSALGAPTAPLIFNGGVLRFLADFNLATSRTITLLSPGGGTIDSNGHSTMISQVITGAGALTTLDSSNTVGTLILTGSNTYQGGTQISSGTLQLGDGTANGSIQGSITDNGTLAFDYNGTVVVSNAIAGIGALHQVAGTTVLISPANTYSAGTLIEPASVLQIGNGTMNGSIGQGTIIDNGTLAFENPSATTFTGAINGSGDLHQIGPGSLILTGNNNYSGGTIIDPGRMLQVGNGGTSGTVGTGDISDAGQLIFNRGGIILVPGQIAGSGSVVQQGPGNLVLIGVNTYAGGTQLNGGTLTLGSNTAIGNGDLTVGGTSTLANTVSANTLQNNVHLNAPLTVTNTTGFTLSGLLDGNGSLIKTGLGRLILTADNVYAGGTTISRGTLQLGQGGTTGRIVGNISNNGILVIEHSDKVELPAVISGTGSLVQIGTGTTFVSGDNSYSGGTAILSGALVAGTDSALTSTALGHGNVLLLNGLLRTSSLETGQPLAISVGRNYDQFRFGTLSLGIGGIKTAQYDRIRAQGSARLGGTLDVDSLNGFRPSAFQGFLVVRVANQASGRFNKINDAFNTNPNLTRFDVYAPNGFALFYIQLPKPPEPPNPPNPPNPPGPPEPEEIVDPIPEPLPDPGPDQPLPPDFLVPVLDPTVEQLTSLFEIGFSGANIQRLNLAQRMEDIQNGSTGFSSNVSINSTPATEGKNVVDGKSGKSVVQPQPVLLPTRENRWGVWVTGFGDFVSLDSDNLAQGYSFTTGGVMLGVDYRVTPHFAIGVSGSYAHTWTSLQPSGHVDVGTGRGGVYATYFDHGFYLNAAAYGGYNSYDTSRQGLFGQAQGSTDGEEFSTFLGGGYDWHFGSFAVGPLAYLQYTNVRINGYQENGSDFPLQIHSDSEDSLRSDLGFRASFDWAIGHIHLVPSVTAAWEHEFFYSALPITANLPGIPGTTGTFFGPAEGHESAVISAGVGIRFTSTLSAYVSYDGQLARDNYSSNAVTGGVSFSF